MSSSDPNSRTPEEYLAVLRAADSVVDGLAQLERSAATTDDQDWAARRRRAGETEAAFLGAASARGRLADYEAAGRALVAERVPLQDAPPALADVAAVVAERLDALAEVLRATFTVEAPDPGALSIALRAAGQAHRSREYSAVDSVKIARPQRRAAADRPDEPKPRAWHPRTGSVSLVLEAGEHYLEVWAIDADPLGPDLAPLVFRSGDDEQWLFAIFDAVRRAYLRVPFTVDEVTVGPARPVNVTDLEPRDVGTVLASIVATSRSSRGHWLAAIDNVAWLATVVAQTGWDDGVD